MKKYSIKIKVTLWYTGIVAMILGIIFVAMIAFVNKVGMSSTEEEIQGAVTGFAGNISFRDNTFYLDSDVEFYNDGVMFCVYDKSGHLLYGSQPVDFPSNTRLESHKTRVVKVNGKEWMTYDAAYSYGKNDAIWVRGITSIHSIEQVIRTGAKAMMILLPALIVLIGFVGYFMIRRALGPVDKICEQVQKISNGNDLSRRLPVPRAEDELYHLTQKFNEMFERLQKSFEDEKQFTADVSHELRTPIAVLISQCEYLLDDPMLTAEEQSEVQILLEQSRRMSRLVSQLLMIAREEQSVSTEDFEEIDMGMLAEIVAEELEGEARKKQIVIHREIEEDQIICGDQTLLMRMLMNLIQNAVAYGKEGGSIWIRITGGRGQVMGQIRDNGIGISKEHLDKIWNRFYRVDKSRSRKNGGTGLGLSMVKWIVKVHGGEISVESREGEGTTFTFWFPKK